MIVVEGQDQASMLRGRVDDLGLEDGSPAASEETADRSWKNGTTSNLIVVYFKLASGYDSIGEVGKVFGSFGGGS